MATIGPVALTLVDWAKRIDDDGKIAQIINLLSQTNEILDDMLWVEGNLPTGHKTTIRTGLPSAYWRLLNQGVPRGKSTTAQITESCGMLETYSDIDVDLVALSGNDRAFRLSEELAFLEGMNQQMAGRVYYAAERGTVGLPYQSQLQTLCMEPEGMAMQVQDYRKKIAAVVLRVRDTRGLKVGPNFNTLTEIKERSALVSMGAAVPLFTGDERVIISADYLVDDDVCVQQDNPLPCTVLGVIPEVSIGDSPG